ncbi:MAG: sigma-54-dependent Fis family transcriptional regulator [Desulfovibrionaceae bacterium]|jgi:DNA-binding NtrC family response regulator|nr:sigma-54-dependent Fis family transcriptional regulator [Desulfovibrionaceae bacterium]
MSDLDVLLVDDSPEAVLALAHTLGQEGCAVTPCAEPEAAIAVLQRRAVDLVLVGLGGAMHGASGPDRAEHDAGMRLLRTIKDRWPWVVVVMLTAADSVEQAVEAIRQGAFDYLPTPFGPDQVRALLQKARVKVLVQHELVELRDMVRNHVGPQLIGKSPQIQELRELIAHVAPLDCTVLLRGETGTGKELVAKIIHQNSPRADQKFLAVNSGALSEELMANELFGHEREAFTGARGLKKGIFEALDGGVLLLDEIGDMPYANQIQLLRVLQEKTIIRVGGTEEVPVDVRVLAATNRGLKDAVARGTFREDLFFRLNVFTLRIPALRDRTDDIPLFCHHFLAQYAQQYKKPVERFSDEVMDIFMAYEFPGNVRELKNVIERCVILADGQVVRRAHLPRRFAGRLPASPHAAHDTGPMPTLAEVEADYLRQVLRRVNGNKTRAAEILGIDRVSLWRKLKRLEADAAPAPTSAPTPPQGS